MGSWSGKARQAMRRGELGVTLAPLLSWITKMLECTLCRDTGWLLDAKDRGGVITMEIYRCLIPDCSRSGQEVALLSLGDMQFDRCAHHPKDRYIMSLSKRR